MGRTFHLDAIVLKHFDFGEADRILVVFSRQNGKIKAIAKGVRKIRSRKAGHLEPFTQARVFLSQGRDLPIITQAETTDSFNEVRSDLLKIGYASYIVELVDRFLVDNDSNPALYQLVLGCLRRIERDTNVKSAVLFFELHLLDMQGFKPELFLCIKCRQPIKPENQYFSAELGGVLCPQCGNTISLAQPISMDVLKYLRHFQRISFEETERIIIPKSLGDEAERIIRHYMTFLLERRLNSPDFIKVVEHLMTLSI